MLTVENSRELRVLMSMQVMQPGGSSGQQSNVKLGNSCWPVSHSYLVQAPTVVPNPGNSHSFLESSNSAVASGK